MLENERHERKFILPQESFYDCQAFVRSLPLNFKKIYSPRQVNNVYFDSPSLNCLFHTIDGEANRFKLRARWYGSFSGHSNVQLEVKSKINLLGYKSTFDLGQIEIEPSDLISKNVYDKVISRTSSRRDSSSICEST